MMMAIANNPAIVVSCRPENPVTRAIPERAPMTPP
jgi:hypothetical protein